MNKKPEITITFFIKDKTKTGGSYDTFTGFVKKLDFDNQIISFVDGKQIPINDIIDISGEMFKMFE